MHQMVLTIKILASS